MKNNEKLTAFILAAIMLIFNLPQAFAENSTVKISNGKDFAKFSKKCTLDTYSVGKTVELTCDISLENTDFTPIPTFGGTFNGNGYTIRGVKYIKNGSYLGLFRYIQSSGKVSDLTVEGEFTPGGSKNFIGGITGENNGIIVNCSFSGKIIGENVAGGIAGKNTNSGQIISCTADGSVMCENYCGGISGKNDGLIIDCTNNAQVNTVFEEKKLDIKDIDVDRGAIIESYKTAREENEEESILGHTDSGGITGYNSGILQGCTNNAVVGYPHVGYNIGGITGRQSGYILGCKNYGLVKGRKDVGGIVGQMEPYILLDVSKTSLKGIREELGTLNKMVNRFVSDTDALSSDVEKHLSNISEHSENARNSAQTLLNQGTDFVDSNLDELNAETAVISNALDKLAPQLNGISDGASDIADAINKIKILLEVNGISDSEQLENIDAINNALSDISSAERQLNKASERARRGVSELDSALYIKDADAVDKATTDLSASLKDIINAKTGINNALMDIEKILSSSPDPISAIGGNSKEILDVITEIRKSSQSSLSALRTASQSLDTILLNTDLSLKSFKDGMHDLEIALVYMTDAMGYIAKSIERLRHMTITGFDFSDALTTMSNAANKISSAIYDMSQTVSDLSENNDLKFVKLGDEFKTANDDLFSSLSGISDEITKLRSSASGGRSDIANDANALNNQFTAVMNSLIDGMEELQSFGDLSDIFLDISDEDIENTKQGKVAECENHGKIESDRNTGGIAGSLAIEYAKDPENDIEKPDSLNFTYRTKAILEGCINDGDVIGKKDCTGGCVGLSEIGIIYKCENYGNAESSGGNYVGGIAGKSESGIRKCCSKCRLSGNDYIGGIAGKAISLSSCRAIASVSGKEETGSVLGACDDPYKLSQNFYLDKGMGAIDGISYTDIAEPLSFEKFSALSDMPRRMTVFTVTFLSDDKVIDTQDFGYNESVSNIKYPEIPEKDGYFGSWIQTDAKTITEDIDILCEYSPYITVLASEEKNKSRKLALALAEGEFTDKAKLNIKKSKETPYKKPHENIKVYDITLSGTDIKDGDTVTLRLLNEDNKSVSAWRLNDRKWERIVSSKRGKYVVIKIHSANETIRLKYHNTALAFLWLILTLVLASILAYIMLKKKMIFKN